MIIAALSSTEDPVLVLPTLRVSFLSSKVLMFTGFGGIGAMGYGSFVFRSKKKL
jgi:hypothetical protein